MKLAFVALILACNSGAARAADAVTEPPMVSIPGGTFSMGSTTTAAKPPYPVEQPVHEVRIAPFQIGKYEVTVGQFRQFIKATGHKMADTCWRFAANEWGMDRVKGSWDDQATAPSEYHPVSCVSWADARAYATWLSAQTGKPYRLPSEAEWEYAARAGSSQKYHFGSDDTQVCRYGNIRDTLGREAIGKLIGKPGKRATCSDGAEFASVVGMYLPNVGEIVEDCEHQNYVGAPQDGKAWLTDCPNTMKMHRGGFFATRVAGAAVSARGHTGDLNASSFEGFRVVLGAPGPAVASPATRAFEAALDQARAAERTRRKPG